MQNNRRQLARHKLASSLDVWDSATDMRLGQLVNLHRQGLMLLGDGDFGENKVYRLAIHLPQSVCADGELLLGVDCLWVKRDPDTGLHWAGFQIIDASAEQLGIIDAVIAALAAA